MKELICRLCGNIIDEHSKRKSHALTKSSFFNQQNLKNGEHALVINERIGVIDAGKQTWEYAFCPKCENDMSKWEDEREKFLNDVTRLDASPEEIVAQKVYGYDKEKIALACLAELYRCSVFQKEAYKDVSLGEKHSKKLREILLNGKINNYFDYPIVFMRYNNSSSILDECFLVPQAKRLGQARLYEVLAPRGWVWFIRVDSRELEDVFKIATLGQSDCIIVLNKGGYLDPRNIGFLNKIKKTLIENEQKVLRHLPKNPKP